MSEFVSENEILKYSNKLRVCFSCILKFLSYNVCYLIAFLCVKSTMVVFA